MIQNNNLTAQKSRTGLLVKRMLMGGCIGLIVISFFVFGVPEPNPAWGKFWMMRPLIVTPLSGVCGGIVFHLLDPLRYMGGWKKIAANILGVLVFIAGIWMGIVLGLVGTMWH